MLKKPSSYDEQIALLHQHRMTVEDDDQAKDVLHRISYYRLSGYALQFRVSPNDSDFCEGSCNFEALLKIYEFDKKMRDVLRKHIETAEVYYRTQIAHNYAIRKCMDPPHEQHYDRRNYYAKEYFDQVMESFKKQKIYFKDTLVAKHHQQVYRDKYPLWVMVEMLSFSNLSKLYASMYFSEKDAIAQAVGTGRETLENHLHCLSVLRNKCAHAGRLYNTRYNPPAKWSTRILKRLKGVNNSSLFAYILVLEKRLPTKEDKVLLVSDVERIIQEHQSEINMDLIGFPANYSDILHNEMN